MEGHGYWLDEVRLKLKRKNRILFAKDAEFLRDLTTLFREQEHRSMVLWALDLAAESVTKLEETYPDESRPRQALESAWAWAEGKIRMRLVQRKILDCHALAKQVDSKEDAAICHAIGQACAVVHTAGHSIGYPMYELSAIIYRFGIENCSEAVEKRKQDYTEKLFYWNEHVSDYDCNWADFMLK